VDDETARQWLVFAALMPYAVHHDHRVARVEEEQRRARERAHRLMTRIPVQRTRTITLPQREPVPRGTRPWHG
jgi:D-serine deaminase-like pyridoxal phosphate-dependent protein